MPRSLQEITDDMKVACTTIANANAVMAKGLSGVDLGNRPVILVDVNGRQMNLLDLADELVAAVGAQSQP